MTERERRRYERLQKKFVITYHPADEPEVSYDISQIKNISLGGMCFVATRTYAPGTKLAIALQTPFIWDRLSLPAEVLESKEMAKDLIYETRVAFAALDDNAKHYLGKTIEVFMKKEKEKEKEKE